MELLQEYFKRLQLNKDNNDTHFELANSVMADKQYITRNVTLSKHPTSLSYLIKHNLSQRQCIQFGILFEKYLMDLILSHNKQLKSIKPKNKKGSQEKDHLFEDTANKIIIYSELKANINLDTEKTKSTIAKCYKIKAELKEKYPKHTIHMRLVALRYLSKEYIPFSLQRKYSKISEFLVGTNEYLKLCNISFQFIDEKEYAKLLNTLVAKFII